MTGKRKSLNRILVTILGTLVLTQGISAQENTCLEQLALDYFCTYVSEIQTGLNDYNIRFSGNTENTGSSIYKIADCLGDISLIKDSIPNKAVLDQLESDVKSKSYASASLSFESCSFLKKRVFAPFNRRILTLSVYNAVEYNGNYYVELHLRNKKLNNWFIFIKFDENKTIVEHCKSFMVF